MLKNKTLQRFIFFFLAVTGLVTWISCNKGYDRLLPDKTYQDTTSSVAKYPHVLYIVVDGARGQSVQQVQPPNIMSLTSHAIYCWHDIADTTSLNFTNWATLLTGVTKDKHQVVTPDLSQSNLENYPVFFNRIKEKDPDFKIAAFSSSDSLKSLISGADVNQSFNNNDAAVEKAALGALKKDMARLVFVQFNSVDTAGAKYGYDTSVPQYKGAILNVDGYIGKMMDEINSHKDSAQEAWMVVITSNRGGKFPVPSDGTVLTDPVANSFVIFYAPIYKPSFIDKPGGGSNAASKMPQAVDIPRQIFSWLRIQVDPVWNLDGKVWTTGFEGILQ